jgi:tetratricopeptide (TPR) repeat protein
MAATRAKVRLEAAEEVVFTDERPAPAKEEIPSEPQSEPQLETKPEPQRVAPEAVQTEKAAETEEAAAAEPEPETKVETEAGGTPPPSERAPDLAMSFYLKAINQAPGSKERLEGLAQAVQLDPEQILFQRALLGEFYQRQEYESCVDACRQALELDPSNSMIATIMGSAYFRLDRVEPARQAFARAIEMDPANHYARYNLALALTRQESAGAAQAWREFLECSENADDTDLESLRQEARGWLAAHEK